MVIDTTADGMQVIEHPVTGIVLAKATVSSKSAKAV